MAGGLGFSRTMSLPSGHWDAAAKEKPPGGALAGRPMALLRAALTSVRAQSPLLLCVAIILWATTSFQLTVFTPAPTGPSPVEESAKRDLPLAAGAGLRFRSLREQPAVAGGSGGGADDVPSMTIFCAPKPYSGEPNDGQRRALLSWLRLEPTPNIVLLGSDPSFDALAKEFPAYVRVEEAIDYNFIGVPMFHSMMERARAADTDLSMIINGDIILLNDLMPAIQNVRAKFDNWVLTAARWDVAEDFPFEFEGLPKSVQPAARRVRTINEEQIRSHVHSTGNLHTYGGVDFWLWNNSPVPLHSVTMPPFVFGRGKYDNWLTHEIVASGLREMVDSSDSVTSIHVAHAYSHVAESNSTAGVSAKLNFWSTRKKSSFELFSNIHLAQAHGSYTNQKGTALHVPWRLAACYEPAVKNMCLLRRVRPANCSCEYSAYTQTSQSDPKLNKNRQWTCGSLSVDKQQDYEIKAIAEPNATPGLPHTMTQLLPKVADENGVVTLVAVTMGYAEMLMNFVCRLRRLGMDKNLLIAALDEDLYKFAFTQGLAVYYENNKLANIEDGTCAFGSQCFRQFTKLKSRAVLHVLKAGYSVLWTDVDIIWYTNPLPHLMAFGPNTFPIQSNEPNGSIPGNGIRRINSGFYFARADNITIRAFEAITSHAAKTKLSEQPSFYDVLCGEKGQLKGKKDDCNWHGLRTILLDRKQYPNGAVHKFWEAPDVTEACQKAGCIMLHNNWISGKDAKKERMVKNGYWHYDHSTRQCIHDWYNPKVQATNAATETAS